MGNEPQTHPKKGGTKRYDERRKKFSLLGKSTAPCARTL
jgi:hypothetical protein